MDLCRLAADDACVRFHLHSSYVKCQPCRQWRLLQRCWSEFLGARVQSRPLAAARLVLLALLRQPFLQLLLPLPVLLLRLLQLVCEAARRLLLLLLLHGLARM